MSCGGAARDGDEDGGVVVQELRKVAYTNGTIEAMQVASSGWSWWSSAA
jgi:hypothetical protein